MGATLKVAGWITVGAIAGALASMQFSATARSTPNVGLPLEELQQLAQVYGLVRANYVDPVDDKKLINDAIAGMVSGLDPHSQYFDKKTFGEFREGTSGKFVGVGIEIGMEDGLVRVVSPIEGSPAFRAGLRANDLITRIDETNVRGLTMDQAVKRMRGEPNTKVVLNIWRRSENRTFPVTIVREEIRTQSVRAKIVEPGYGWVRVSQFQDRTVDDFARKVEELFKQDPKLKGLVLDLRNDPGGNLEGAIAISSAFLPAGVEVTSTKGQVEAARFTYRAVPQHYLRPGQQDVIKKLPAALKSLPLVVLVNEGSASASEIVAGALQDHKRATVMGGQTFGKGSVQSVRCLAGSVRLDECPGAAIKLTTARYFTPNDRSIQAQGIVPDVPLDETAEGNVFAAFYTREADLDRHLANGDKAAEEEAAKARDAERKRLEELRAKRNEPFKPLPEFGSPEDWPLQQALNQLQGKTVVVSKAITERKAQADVPKP
jgi:carboxyl-terminal processing protease